MVFEVVGGIWLRSKRDQVAIGYIYIILYSLWNHKSTIAVVVEHGYALCSTIQHIQQILSCENLGV